MRRALVICFSISLSVISLPRRRCCTWNQALFEDDVKTYASYGIRNITTYTSYISANYVKKFGYPDCIDKYATYLRDFVKK